MIADQMAGGRPDTANRWRVQRIGRLTVLASEIITIHSNQGALPVKNGSIARVTGTRRRPTRRDTASPATSQNGTNANDWAPSAISRMLGRLEARNETAQPRNRRRSAGRRNGEPPAASSLSARKVGTGGTRTGASPLAIYHCP